MSASNPLPVDLEHAVLVREANGNFRPRADDEITGASSMHKRFILARATAVSRAHACIAVWKKVAHFCACLLS